MKILVLKLTLVTRLFYFLLQNSKQLSTQQGTIALKCSEISYCLHTFSMRKIGIS